MRKRFKVEDNMKENKDTVYQKWWDSMTDEERDEFLNIPCFDPDFWYKLTGIIL